MVKNVNSDDRQKSLKEIIKSLHDGEDFESVKKRFTELIKNVSPEEISDMENSLINEGFPVEQIQNLCNVHVAVFEDALIKQNKTFKLSGHPVHTFIQENKELKNIMKKFRNMRERYLKNPDEKNGNEFKSQLKNLKEINYHFLRKENQLFPFLEKKGFSGPSKVMWHKHDEIRAFFKELEDALSKKDMKSITTVSKKLLDELKGMIFKEEMILFPTSIKKLDVKEWVDIKKGESQIGFSWIKPGNLWDASLALTMQGKKNQKNPSDQELKLDTGGLTLNELNLMLVNLPVDVSYVDADDRVKYYSNNKDRIFPRSPGVIGREVQNCHPQKSVHVVNKIIDSFKKKEKKDAQFWIEMNGKTIFIRYIALYGEKGEYKGVLEISQDISDLKKISGEKRLLDW